MGLEPAGPLATAYRGHVKETSLFNVPISNHVHKSQVPLFIPMPGQNPRGQAEETPSASVVTGDDGARMAAQE